MLILISAGHSTVPPKDCGAVGHGFQEAQIALEMRDRVAKILRARGCSVLTDGADGINEPLKKAITLAKKADLAIEFHLNASANQTASGVECLSLPAKKVMSQKISAAIAGVTGSRLRGDSGWLNQNAGQHHRLGFCMVGGVIVELCFISNKDELTRFLDRRGEVAAAIADVICGKKPETAIAVAEYVIAAGDTLYGIGNRFKISVDNLIKLNNLPDGKILPGQKLKLR